MQLSCDSYPLLLPYLSTLFISGGSNRAINTGITVRNRKEGFFFSVWAATETEIETEVEAEVDEEEDVMSSAVTSVTALSSPVESELLWLRVTTSPVRVDVGEVASVPMLAEDSSDLSSFSLTSFDPLSLSLSLLLSSSSITRRRRITSLNGSL